MSLILLLKLQKNFFSYPLYKKNQVKVSDSHRGFSVHWGIYDGGLSRCRPKGKLHLGIR